jgi:pyridoxal phosphate enzyme (YggS family)
MTAGHFPAATIAGNLRAIRERIAGAARRAGRDPGSVTLVGVSKTVAPERIREAVEAGLLDLGENRVQEARDKVPLLPPTVRWHLVGHLQSNKVNAAVRLFGAVHSVDSADLLRQLERAAEREGRALEAFVQIDLAGETTKFGAREEDLDEILKVAATCRAVELRGLMILPPYDPDPERSRPYFRRLRELLAAARGRHPAARLDRVSMGMSEDFEVAIEEGATVVRVGRALFGERGTHANGGG